MDFNQSETINFDHNLEEIVHHPPRGDREMNKLYFGDNLDVLREKIKDESVDLVYLDPPFNSDANYNVLFNSGGQASEAQAEAFRDTWEWLQPASDAYDDVMRANGDVALVLSGLRKWLGESAMMAYLSMMAVRLIELRRVMKPTGSLYLHCDPTASHYLKLVLDSVFTPAGFQNEITWKRRYAHSDGHRYGNVADKIFFYTHSDKYTWHQPFQPYEQEYIDTYYRYSDPDGRKWLSRSTTAPGGRGPRYIWNGHVRAWRYTEANMQELHDKGRLYYTTNGIPRYKQYLDEMPGMPAQSIWTDVKPLNSWMSEQLGYPTQKPVALLDRIISASSNPGDVVLDPFCGCGTTVEAAEALGRQWVGIDVTHYAVTLIESRLKAKYPTADYSVYGRPTDIAGARDLAGRDKHQFQWWAAWRLGARWYREEKKGADRGIDGRILFKNGPYGDGLIIISVKGGENIGVRDVRDLRGVIEREDAEMGILVSLEEPTRDMMRETAAAGFLAQSAHGKLPRLQTVTIGEILSGRPPKLPPLPEIEQRPVQLPRKRDREQLELLLPFAGNKPMPAKGDFVDPSILRFG